ncbi:MAG TPA: ATP-dependent DNA helicase [Hellea balneolensis]|uniref:ATP-dependent DNA helicase n=1 Tax=Hellea balneolensis TaxID=287478 RepID=A0A7C5M031_9PROT|nr:ATP-dependent DNA helicase [Hellea balneolensis]
MNFPAQITAVLGATNTGKTHYALERMLARTTAVIGLPLRLLAREIYDKAVKIKGKSACALITGEEKIIPPHAQYFICTLEAMPMEDICAGKFACVVIDEIQLMNHPERGHVFTDRVIRARGTEETLLLGAQTARPLVEALVPNARYHSRERFSVLKYTGHAKITRLPKRTIIVAFNANDVYSHAELIRRHYGGAAVIMGGLSPRTRNAQAKLYQSGEVNYLIATDAIGMGLNLDADHVAFAALRKFDGERRRYLHAHEIGQIAGRAGRFRTNGSFGTTGRSLPLDEDIALRIENHEYEPLYGANWRNTALDFHSAHALLDSLAKPAPSPKLRRTAPVLDELVFERLIKFHDFTQVLHTPQAVKRVWDLCQLPDFRNLGVEAHSRLVDELYTHMNSQGGGIHDAYFEAAIARLNHTEGNIDILSARLAAIRTWAYIANKPDWLISKKNWVEPTRKVEEALSDALHTKLMQRFVDKRTSALIKGMRRKTDMEIEIKPDGVVSAEGHVIGQLNGLDFKVDDSQNQLEDKTLRAAAELALAPEIDKRLIEIAGADHGQFSLNSRGEFLWGQDAVARLAVGTSLLAPDVELIGGALGSSVLCDQAAGRIRDYLRTEIADKFEQVLAVKSFIDDPTSFKGAKPLLRVLYENAGIIRRNPYRDLIRETDNAARGYIYNLGGRITKYFVYMEGLMKPGASRLASLIFAYAWDKDGGGNATPFLPKDGPSSIPNQEQFTETVLNRCGFSRYGPRIIRMDILENLLRMIWHARDEKRYGRGRFRISQHMMSVLGCNYEDMREVLMRLEYQPFDYELTPEEFAEEDKYYSGKKLNPNRHPELAKKIKVLEEPPTETSAEPPEEPTPPVAAQSTQAETIPPHKKGMSAMGQPVRQVHKKRRPIVLADYYPPPEYDEYGNAITPTHIELWRLNNRKRHNRNPQDGNRQSAYKKGTGFAYQAGPKNKPYTTRSSSPSMATPTKKRAKPMSKQDKIARYANITSKLKSPVDAKGPQPKTSKSGKNDTSTPADDSPFAALAALKFDKDKKSKD